MNGVDKDEAEGGDARGHHRIQSAGNAVDEGRPALHQRRHVLRRRRHVGHAEGALIAVAQPVLFGPILNGLVVRVRHDRVLQVHQVLLVDLAWLVGLLEQPHEDAPLVFRGRFSFDRVAVLRLVQIGPVQSAVQQFPIQSLDELARGLQHLGADQVHDHLGALDSGAVVPSSQTVEVHAPARISLCGSHEVLARVEKVDVAPGHRWILHDRTAREMLPNTAEHPHVLPVGRLPHRLTKLFGGQMLCCRGEQRQIDAFVLEREEQVSEKIVFAGRRAGRRHGQAVCRGEDPRDRTDHGRTAYLEDWQVQSASNKFIADQRHGFL
uniref:Uncharacterized protein n=1 Tax=Variovorax paradoxus (strain S110) TaxID=543728 RepID=C5D1D3_VARPS